MSKYLQYVETSRKQQKKKKKVKKQYHKEKLKQNQIIRENS